MAALGGEPDVGEFHAVGFRRELLPVGFQLGVVDQAIIVADIEAELLLGAGDMARGLREELRKESQAAEREDPQASFHKSSSVSIGAIIPKRGSAMNCRSLIRHQRHESEIHVELLMAVEQARARVIGDNIGLDGLVRGNEYDILDDARDWLAVEAH